MSIADTPFDDRNRLLILVKRHNLIGRIHRLGVELSECNRSFAQQKLSEIAEDQGWGSNVMHFAKAGLPHPCRPLWAGGAFL